MRVVVNKKLFVSLLCLFLAFTPQLTFAQNTYLNKIFQAKAAQDAGEYSKAEELWKEVIKLNPKESDAYAGLGDLLRLKRKYTDAIAAYRQAINIDPKNAYAYIGMGMALRSPNKLNESIAAFRKAIEIEPDNVDAYIQLSITLAKNKKFQEAKLNSQKAIQLEGNDSEAYVVLGNTLRLEGNQKEAIKAYQQALTLKENLREDRIVPKTNAHALAHNGLGLIMLSQGNTKAAILEFKKAIQLDPKYILAQNNLKEAERQLKQRQNPNQSMLPENLPKTEPLLNVMRSVVRITARFDSGNTVNGTGWIFKRQGSKAWIITNRHVLVDPEVDNLVTKNVEAEFYSEPPPNKPRFRQSAIIKKITNIDDERIDLAVLEINNVPKDIQPLKFSSITIVRESVIRIIGHPKDGIDWAVEQGKISSKNNEQIQISGATVVPGNSGSPVLDKQNRVVGVVYQRDDFGFAYNIKYVTEKLQSWRVYL
jgi:tetratricopeptide (TPR) repeat protein